MWRLTRLVLVVVLIAGCSSSKFSDLQDTSEAEKTQAKDLWQSYLKQLGSRSVSKDPILIASHFSKALIASTDEATFIKKIKKCLGRRSAGAFANVKIEALKNGPEGLLLIVDSKAGEAAIPLINERNKLKFAELRASTGEWNVAAKHGPSKMPAETSLLYIKMMLVDKQAPIGDRLRAAVDLADVKYRKVIIASQRSVENPIVRLGLGLARIKIDGSDESFIKNFPTSSAGISALAQADNKIFDEMVSKLSNMGAMVEDPPANEILYKVVAAAPAAMRQQMGQAIYKMAELSPGRLANAIRNLSKDIEKDPVLQIYLEEVKRQGGKAPKVMKFLKKFSRIGEFAERKLCKSLLSLISKAK
ncbi:MAG: hypothetical protein JRJ87_17785 [Deltaproteobacteria bacterium]|nr:hypothetical protein [Deltaproteobacteria bacterium]